MHSGKHVVGIWTAPVTGPVSEGSVVKFGACRTLVVSGRGGAADIESLPGTMAGFSGDRGGDERGRHRPQPLAATITALRPGDCCGDSARVAQCSAPKTRHQCHQWGPDARTEPYDDRARIGVRLFW